MANKAQPQGRVPRQTVGHPSHQAVGHPSSMRTVAGTSTHVDATNKMMTAPSTDMAFLDNYLSTLSSDLNTPEIDLKAFDFGKKNAKSNLVVTGMEKSKMASTPEPLSSNTAFFDMSISSPPSFMDEDSATTQNNSMERLFQSHDFDNSMVPIESVVKQEPISKAPLLTSSQPLGVISGGHRNNPVTQPSEMPFDIPNEFFNDTYLFPDAELGLGLEDELLNSSVNLDKYLGYQGLENDTLCFENDILSQAVAGAVLPTQEQLNNLLETPGMMPPTIAQQQPAHLASFESYPAQLAPSLLSHASAPQEIVIPNLFLETSEYQTITYQVQGVALNPSQQDQNISRDSVQLMEVDNTTSSMINFDNSDSVNFNFLPSSSTYSDQIIELPEELEIKPEVDIYDEAVPSTSTGKRRRTVQKPARYRDSLVDYPIEESQPSESILVEKKLKLTDEEKYNRIRIMNNEASRKCRQKRKQNISHMGQEITELENKQKILRAKEAELTKMRDKMKALYYEFMKRQMAPRPR